MMNSRDKTSCRPSRIHSNRRSSHCKRKATTSNWLPLWTTATAAVCVCSITSMVQVVEAFSVTSLSSRRGQATIIPLPQHSTCYSNNYMSNIILNVSRTHPIQTTNNSLPKMENDIPKITNLFDLEEIMLSNNKPTYTINVEAEATSSIMNRKIAKLLSDDDGEEDDEIPDYSEAAANEIADKSSYSRISEEAKIKANYAVQKVKKGDEIGGGGGDRSIFKSENDVMESNFDVEEDGESDDEGLLVSELSKRQKTRRFTASVKETGVDTMSQYVKSMGSHELLPKDSEILLGKQIQILVEWEKTRQELEETLSK